MNIQESITRAKQLIESERQHQLELGYTAAHDDSTLCVKLVDGSEEIPTLCPVR